MLLLVLKITYILYFGVSAYPSSGSEPSGSCARVRTQLYRNDVESVDTSLLY